MLKKLFSPGKSYVKCMVFYCFTFDRGVTKDLLNFMINYFKTNYNIHFKYAGFWDEKYDDKYGKFETIYSKLIQTKASEIVNFAFDVEDIREKRRSISVEFNITRPKRITIVLPDEYDLNIVDFVEKVSIYFGIIYGFSYVTSEKYWTTSYAMGDWQHTKGIKNVKHLSKQTFQQWLNICEKIQEGYIRDVYDVNIFNKAQLDKQLNGEMLRDFIINRNMGELISINDDLSLWKLDLEQLEDARAYIYKSNILV